ncbi:hypothetical protein GCM10010417_48610 [Streptomyces carpaticus]
MDEDCRHFGFSNGLLSWLKGRSAESGKEPLAGGVERGIDPARSGGTDAIDQAPAVGDRGRSETPDEVGVGSPGDADHRHTPLSRELHGGAAQSTARAR